MAIEQLQAIQAAEEVAEVAEAPVEMPEVVLEGSAPDGELEAEAPLPDLSKLKQEEGEPVPLETKPKSPG